MNMPRLRRTFTWKKDQNHCRYINIVPFLTETSHFQCDDLKKDLQLFSPEILMENGNAFIDIGIGKREIHLKLASEWRWDECKDFAEFVHEEGLGVPSNNPLLDSEEVIMQAFLRLLTNE